MRSLRWLIPGMGVKRWLLLLLAGVTVLALGIAYLLIDLYQTAILPTGLQAVATVLTLQQLPQPARALLFAAAGLALLAGGLVGLNRSLLAAVRPQRSADLLTLVDRRRRSRGGAKIVAIGGGTGLSTLLRGLKEHTSSITAIVTVADDGGSSGRLRRSLGVHPPGDFRQCITALADTEPLMQGLFEYRFGEGELGGHAFGNLFIVALTGITGSFESALRASSRVLAVHGRIVPSTLAHVTLFAELEDDRVIEGESQVPQGRAPIRKVYLEPPDAPAFPEAVSAILAADLVVLGPGSLYTSLIPNLLVPNLSAALSATAAPLVYVANVATQPGETDGYSLEDHARAVLGSLASRRLDVVLANANHSVELPESWGVTYVRPTGDGAAAPIDATVVSADVIDGSRPTRHDPAKLASAVMAVWREHSASRRSAA